MGAFISNGLRLAQGYQEGRTSFVFRFNGDSCLVHRWGGANDNVILAEVESLTIGGGTSGSALRLARSLSGVEDMFEGTSRPCDTFGTESSLASCDEFKIVDLEAWTVVKNAIPEETLQDNIQQLGDIRVRSCPRLRNSSLAY